MDHVVRSWFGGIKEFCGSLVKMLEWLLHLRDGGPYWILFGYCIAETLRCWV